MHNSEDQGKRNLSAILRAFRRGGRTSEGRDGAAHFASIGSKCDFQFMNMHFVQSTNYEQTTSELRFSIADQKVSEIFGKFKNFSNHSEFFESLADRLPDFMIFTHRFGQ